MKCIQIVGELDSFCGKKLGDVFPGSWDLKNGIQEVRNKIHSSLQKKRETEPDEGGASAVEETPTAEAVGEPGANVTSARAGALPPAL